MAVHFNTSLDDTLIYDRQAAFTGGMMSWVRANLLDLQHAAALMDCDVETSLVLSNRRGFHLLGTLAGGTGLEQQGLWWFDSEGRQLLLAVSRGKLWRMDSGRNWVLVDGVATANLTGPVSGDQVGDYFWLSGSTGNIKAWTGTQLQAGGTLGTTVPDGPKPPNPGSALLQLTASRFRLFGINPVRRDEVFCSRFLPTPTAEPPFTLAGQPILPFRVGEGEGDPLIALVPWKGLFSLLGIKRDSVWQIDTTPAGNTTTAATITANFGSTQLSGRVGAVAPRSLARCGNDVLMFAQDGVRSLARTAQEGDGEISDAISQPIMDWVRRINQAALDTVTAVYWAGRYILSVPLDESPIPTHTFVLHIRSNAWMIWTGIQPMAWAVTSFPNEPQRLVCLDARGQVLEWRDWVPWSDITAADYRDEFTLGNPARVPWELITRAFTWGDFEVPKAMDGTELEFDRSTAVVDIDAILDAGAGIPIAANQMTGFGGLILPFVLPAILGEGGVRRIPLSLTHLEMAREVQFRIREAVALTPSEQTSSYLLRVRSVLAGAYLDTIPAQQ